LTIPDRWILWTSRKTGQGRNIQTAELKVAGIIVASEIEDELEQQEEDDETIFDDLVTMRGRLTSKNLVPGVLLDSSSQDGRETGHDHEDKKGRNQVNSGRIDRPFKLGADK
jgi:hypothetical protein